MPTSEDGARIIFCFSSPVSIVLFRRRFNDVLVRNLDEQRAQKEAETAARRYKEEEERSREEQRIEKERQELENRFVCLLFMCFYFFSSVALVLPFAAMPWS